MAFLEISIYLTKKYHLNMMAILKQAKYFRTGIIYEL
jgi:hypothetical protein